MKLLFLFLSLLLILLLAGLWVGSGSYPERWKIQERSTTQELANTKKKEQIESIKAELNDASSGNAAIEERARSELGMMGKDETFYEVILQPDQENTKNKTLEIKSKAIDKTKDKNNKGNE
jgi:cell division protein FtsB